MSTGWNASLKLRFEAIEGVTVLTERVHSGPLRLLKPLYPEGKHICHAVIVHPPGGIVAGDHLQLAINVGSQSHGLITMPGAQKWYRSSALDATADTQLRVEARGQLEWLPQESMVFDGAHVKQTLNIDMHREANFFGWEILCLGRTARNEQFNSGRFQQTIRLQRDGAPLWSEHTLLAGNDRLLNSMLGWGGHPVVGTAWLARGASDRSKLADEAVLANARDALADTSLAAASNPAAGFFVVKALGDSVETVRELLIGVWSRIRMDTFGVAPVLPRIWST